MTQFTTMSAHIGDRPHQPYQPGETREVDDPNTVKHLTEGDDPVLGKHDPKAEADFAKAQKPLANKAEGAASQNKSA